MDLNFLIERKRIKLEDVIRMEEGSLKAQRDLLAACMVDGQGAYLEKDQAIDALNQLDLDQFNAAVAQFLEELSALPLPTKNR